MPVTSQMKETVEREAETEVTEEADTEEIEVEEMVDDEEKAAQDYDFTINHAAACWFIRSSMSVLILYAK